MASSELVIHVTRGPILLDGSSVIRGVIGEMIKKQQNLLKGLLPPQ
jgi:acetyl-CoA carboxylase carboxyltransferase component